MISILRLKFKLYYFKNIFYAINLITVTTFAQGRVEGDPIAKMSPLKLPKIYEQPTGKINKKGEQTLSFFIPSH